MGKSPGKWIKNVLLGKKASKSSFTKVKQKSANEKEVNVHVGAPETCNDVDPQEVSCDPVDAVHVAEQNLRSECRKVSPGQPDGDIPVSENQNADVKEAKELNILTNAEIMAQEKAATRAQAAFRGYLARRAFKALKGIIRLQALIRGHLVRRQAVSTLYCIIGVVKLQALVRGSRIRCTDAGLQVQKVCIVKLEDGKISGFGDVSANFTSLSANAFIRKLLAPSPKVMPLRVQYEVTDPNSVQNWLERWSASTPWKPVSQPKKVVNSKVHIKQGNIHTNEVETSRTKRSVRKTPSLFDNNSSDMEKPRRTLKKVTSHPADSIQETPHNELEKVKRSLRKVQNPVTESPAQLEVTEKPTQSQGKTTSSVIQEISAPSKMNPIENMKGETSLVVKEETSAISKPIEEVTIEEPIEINEPIEFSNGNIAKIKSESLESDEKDENTPVPNGDLKSKEDYMNDNQNSSKRASLPTKQEHAEDGLQNTPKLPSYMQATQSAKAKLRAQGSPRLSQDGDKNNVTRRHSLPSSTNGKVTSVSPRTQKPLQGSGKGGNKSDKSLLSSRDGTGKGGQAEWRR